jgi:hypothetical protein
VLLAFAGLTMIADFVGRCASYPLAGAPA